MIVSPGGNKTMDFISIDFETANAKKSSICAVGLVVVKNNQIALAKQQLIKPHPTHQFDPICIAIHGITEEDVRNQPEFPPIYQSLLKEYVEKYYIFAHSAASADIPMLKQTLELYGEPVPELHCGCTKNLARYFFPHLLNYRLDTIARQLNISLIHHNALSDAMACAAIILRLAHNVGDQIYEISKIGTSSKDHSSQQKLQDRKTAHEVTEIVLDTNNPCYKKEFVLTGLLRSMLRETAHKEIEIRGGYWKETVGKSTDYLVVGESDFIDFHSDKKTTKMKKAEEYKAKGQHIELLSEEEFLEMLG